MKRTFTLALILSLVGLTQSHATKYCEAWGMNNTYGWIHSVHVGDMTNHSNWNGKGYHDYTHKHIKCSPGKSYKVNLKPHMQHGHHEKAHWAVWVDWDYDGHFSEHEKVYYASSYHEVETWLKIPSHAKYGKTRMRVASRWWYAPTSCGYYWYGDVHDYTLHIYQDHHYDPKPSYCSVFGNNDDHGWIKRVELGSIDNTTWWNGYKDFCHYKSTEVDPGDELTIHLTPHIHKQHYGWGHAEIGHWKVWVDWDQDHKFEDDEVMVDSSSFDPLDIPFKVPADAKIGKTRMRVALRFVYEPKACGYYWYGDVEDYCIIVGEKEPDPEPEPEYCSVYGKNDTYGFIKHVEFGAIDKTSGFSPGGYADYTHYSTDVHPGGSYKLKLIPWLNKVYDDYWGWYSTHAGYWTVWIDFDQNGKFESDEKVLWDHTKYSIWTYVKIPHDAKSGPTRMRVALRWIYWPKACGEYWYGEVEDYTVHIGAGSHGHGYLVEGPISAPPVYNDQEMQVFPNPALDRVTISTPGRETMDLEIYNIAGKLLISKSQFISHNSLEISNLVSGSYIAVLRDQKGLKYHRKFIKK